MDTMPKFITDTAAGDTIEIRRDMIETTTMLPQYERDLEWVHVDEHGHEHRYVDGALLTVTRNTEDWWDADGEEHTDVWYECVQCGDVVQPGMKEIPGTGNGMRSFVPGAVHYYLNGEEISADRFEELRAEHSP